MTGAPGVFYTEVSSNHLSRGATSIFYKGNGGCLILVQDSWRHGLFMAGSESDCRCIPEPCTFFTKLHQSPTETGFGSVSDELLALA